MCAVVTVRVYGQCGVVVVRGVCSSDDGRTMEDKKELPGSVSSRG